ncbi:hypothetical protein H6F51_21495 [Cyanobacteria bacterium FACHB-DQ100]|nr:hypothetical protein [Cyanobacteria bacterium FACHB-DQ100]
MPRKRTNFVIDDRVLAALKNMARRSNTSVNRFVENVLFELAKEQGEIDASAEPLGETRGRPSDQYEKASDSTQEEI